VSINAGGGGGGNIAVAVLSNMRLPALGRRLFGDNAPNLNKRVRAELAAAGATVKKGQWTLPDIPGIAGNQSLVTNTNEKVARWLRRYQRSGGNQVSAGGGGGPGTVGGYYDRPTDAEWQARQDALNRGRTTAPPKAPPPKQPPPSAPTPDKYPMPPGLPVMFRNVWASLIAYAVMYALPYIAKKANESWEAYFRRWQDREAAHRAKGRTAGGGPRRGSPRTRTSSLPPGIPQMPPAPAPASPTVVVIRERAPVVPKVEDPTAGLYVPVIWQRPLPVPAPLPAPAPVVSPWLKYGQLLAPFAAPLLSSLTQPGKGAARRRDPLTINTAAPLSSTSSYVFGGGYAGTPGTNTCECKSPKKRGKKRKRTVCYSGTYTEKASGLRKLKKRKVPCK